MVYKQMLLIVNEVLDIGHELQYEKTFNKALLGEEKWSAKIFYNCCYMNGNSTCEEFENTN